MASPSPSPSSSSSPSPSPTSASMSSFLSEQVFFITGVTGFLGKVLLAKLLTVCGTRLGVRSVYVLVRGKKEQSPRDRFEAEVLNNSLMFSPIVQRLGLARIRDIITVLDGDIARSKLGLSAAAYTELTQRTTVILHLAATVNFNERLRFAVDINVLGAKRMLDLGHACPQLRALVHTSTCYVNCIRKTSEEIREKIYPIQFDAAELVEQLVAMTPEEADAATAELIRPHPNTYTFTKFLAEHVCAEARGALPYAVVRPSIIGGAFEFPVPGWVDSFIGPAGLVAAAGMGALHAMIGDEGAVCDLVPVDLVANKLLVVAWHTARLHAAAGAAASANSAVAIYHASTGTANPLLWGEMRTSSNGYFWRRPLQKRVMPNYAVFARSELGFRVIHRVTSVLPAAVSDAKLRLQGKAPKFVRQMQSIEKIVLSLGFFTSFPWKYSNHNSLALADAMAAHDAAEFPIDPRRIHWELYLVHMFEGIRYYLLKETRPADYAYKAHAKL